MIWTMIQLALAGLWAQVWHWGLGIGAIILLCAGSYFSGAIPVLGPFLQPLRKDMLWAAFGIALLLVGQYIGARDEQAKCVAKTHVIERVVTKAVEKSKTKASQSARDPYDDPEN